MNFYTGTGIFLVIALIKTGTSVNVTTLGHFEAVFQGKCSAPNNPCIQLCTELSDNAFECHCHPTYILSIDGYSCLQANSTEGESIPQLPLQEVEEMQNYYYNGSDGGGGAEQMYTSLDEVHLIDSTCVSFLDNYIVLPILSNAYINDNIYIEFKPTKVNGLLLLTGESYELINDYIIITVEQGYVVFRYDCGTGPGVIKSLNPVILNEWNTLNIIRYKWNSWIQLNNYHYNHGKSQGLFSRITFRIPVFLGGANTTSTTYPYFNGQIRKLLINKENYLSDTVSNCCACLHGGICVNNECSCPFGYSGRSCESFVDLQIPFFNETSYLKYKSILSSTTTFLTLDLVVKPLSHDGIILYSGRENLETDLTDYICLLINQGYVEFYADLGNGVGVAKSEVKLGLDTWHKVSITISSRLISLDVNGVSSSNHIPGAFNQLTLENNWFLGGIPNTEWLVSNKINIFTGFYGCIQKVLVNDALINLMGSALIGINIENCQHECNSKPCGHNGYCVPDLGNYKCTHQIETTNVNSIPKFGGDSYIKFTHPDILDRFEGTKLKLKIDIKTSHSSGLIFYTSYNHHVNNDYLKIYLRDGYLNLAISLGSGYKFIKHPKLRLDDEQWHTIEVMRNEQEIRISVDSGNSVVNYIPGKLSNFNIHNGVFIGGVEEIESGRKQSDLGFIGCAKNLFVDDCLLSFEDTVSRNLNFC